MAEIGSSVLTPYVLNIFRSAIFDDDDAEASTAMKDTQRMLTLLQQVNHLAILHHNLTPTVSQRFKRGDFVKVKVLKLDQQKRRVCEPLSCELIHTDYSHRRP